MNSLKTIRLCLGTLLCCVAMGPALSAKAAPAPAVVQPTQEVYQSLPAHNATQSQNAPGFPQEQNSPPAASGPSIATVVMYFENDLFYNTDKYYTNAVQIRAISPPLQSLADNKIFGDAMDDLLKQAEHMQNKTLQYNVSIGFGQQIYTPKDTDSRELQENDRPYAGYMYGLVALHAKQQHMMDTAELAFGMVGPSALGRTAQNGVHRMRDLPLANGWQHQLRDEPTLMATWTRNYRLNSDAVNTGWAWDALPYHSLTAGNVLTQAALGTELRWGWNLPGSFATSQIRPGSGIDAPTTGLLSPKVAGAPTWGWYMFGGSEGKAVAHNIFLDGNTWKDSHSIDKRPLVADLNLGMAVIYEGMRFSYNHVYRTKEFYEQKDGQNFGSMTMSLPF